MSENAQGTWTLKHGIHRGTLMSRDTASQDGFDSLEACIASLEKQERWYNSIGYVIWYAYAYAPDGTEYRIHPGNSYY